MILYVEHENKEKEFITSRKYNDLVDQGLSPKVLERKVI